ncbi:FAD-binding domain-containing protein [Sporormia fimetaria CBS 119925]|uniref:FAD-binding domain-containing protein n=1 Tax=Sporormia fimetaria CBS 119925 TaxID=1340428 RepID=A0A6A6V545_9PLEO|nr:FAD-binding domain-containing protein [Sporormia fimetaria CBS 119925]
MLDWTLLALLPRLAVTAGTTGFAPCDALIAAGLGHRVLLANSDAYEPRVQSYAKAPLRRPWCFVQPYTTDEVSLVIKTLAEADIESGDWHIAVRSGGHSYASSSNLVEGVTIDLGMMNASTYHHDTELASIQPGASWGNVYHNLLQTGNVTVLGGRVAGVGVGGYLVGGGISYYTPREGFACDQVVNYEVVLSNGTVVNANAEEHAELWRALKGGALNFGIVTRFDVRTFPAVDVAFSNTAMASSEVNKTLSALVDFIDDQEENQDDAIYMGLRYNPSVSDSPTVVATQYNTKGDIDSPGFAQFNSIPAISRPWKRASLADAISTSSQFVPPDKVYVYMSTLINNDLSMLHFSKDLFEDLVSSLAAAVGPENFVAGLFLQGIPKYWGDFGQNINRLGVDRLQSNAILYHASITVKPGNKQDAVQARARAEIAALMAKLNEECAEHGSPPEWRYLNYADANQNPLKSYGPENLLSMKKAAKRYDPDEFWQHRVLGGFKLSTAN